MVEIPACKYERVVSGVYTLFVPIEYIEAVEAEHQWLAEKRVTQMHVKLGRPKRPRSTGFRSQNHHLNGHVQQIAQETGDYFDDVKMEVKRKAVSKGYPTITTKRGDIRPMSEADASSADCALLIDTAHEIASFCNVQLKETE